MVQATDSANSTDIVGMPGVGLGSFGIGIDVIQAKNVVDAHIAGTSLVSAGRSVSVTANGGNTIISNAFSFSIGALVAANATVSDINIGSGLDTNGSSQLNGVQSSVDKNISLNQFASGIESSGQRVPTRSTPAARPRATSPANSLNIDDAFSSSSPTGDTEAYISGTTVVQAGGGVTVQATETAAERHGAVGQGTGGALSLGGSVSIINVNSATLAYIDNGVQVSAGGAVKVSAGVQRHRHWPSLRGHGGYRRHRGPGRLHHRQRRGGRLYRLGQHQRCRRGHHGTPVAYRSRPPRCDTTTPRRQAARSRASWRERC